MPFPSTVQASMTPVNEGELGLGANIVLSTDSWQAGLLLGRFAQMKVGVLSNLDGTATPLLAGVVLRELNSLIELPGAAGSAFSGLLVSEKNQDYVRQGLVTVKLAAGSAVPNIFDPVYVINVLGNVDNGNVTPTVGSNVATTAEFIEQVQAGIWLVRIK